MLLRSNTKASVGMEHISTKQASGNHRFLKFLPYAEFTYNAIKNVGLRISYLTNMDYPTISTYLTDFNVREVVPDCTSDILPYDYQDELKKKI